MDSASSKLLQPIRVFVEADGQYADTFLKWTVDFLRRNDHEPVNWGTTSLGGVALTWTRDTLRAADLDVALLVESLEIPKDSKSTSTRFTELVTIIRAVNVPVYCVIIYDPSMGKGVEPLIEARIRESEQQGAVCVPLRVNTQLNRASDTQNVLESLLASILSEHIYAVIRVETDESITVKSVVVFLASLTEAYDGLRAIGSSQSTWGTHELTLAMDIGELRKRLAPEDELSLFAASIHSPGIWDFLGKWNPLEFLLQILKDQHERRKDRSYREAAERKKLELENRLLENKIIAERIEIASQLGLPPAALLDSVTKPIETLGQIEVVTGARLLDKGRRPRSTRSSVSRGVPDEPSRRPGLA
jgi:hypothetical protein